MKIDNDIVNELAIQVGLKCEAVRVELNDMKYDALTGNRHHFVVKLTSIFVINFPKPNVNLLEF